MTVPKAEPENLLRFINFRFNVDSVVLNSETYDVSVKAIRGVREFRTFTFCSLYLAHIFRAAIILSHSWFSLLQPIKNGKKVSFVIL